MQQALRTGWRVRHMGIAAASLALVALLGGCASGPPSPRVSEAHQRSTAVVSPPKALHIEGVPAIPLSLQSQVAPSMRYDSAGLVGWHPTRRELLVSRRAANRNVSLVWRLASPQAQPELLVPSAEPITAAYYEPQASRYAVVVRARQGDEAFQLYRLDEPSQQMTLLTDPERRHQFGVWLHRQSALIYSSVPLDRSSSAHDRRLPTTRLMLLDPLRPQQQRLLAELPGTGWGVAAISPDDRQLALQRYISAQESHVVLMDLTSAQLRRVLPAETAQPAATHRPVAFTPDGSALWLLSDRAGEFTELMRLDLQTQQLQRVAPHWGWDVDSAQPSFDGRYLALRLNVDGRDELRVLEADTGREVRLPPMPVGSVTRALFHRQRPELAFSVNDATSPSRLYSLDLQDGRVYAWNTATETTPAPPATEQTIIRWRSFDARMISGILHKPGAAFSGRHPVLINIHGGPEAQAKPGFVGRTQYLIQALGMAVISPNVRGSSGFGKTFLALDNGRLREDAVRDIGALLDWIAQQPDLDPDRVVVSGGSYGGYMSLAVAVHYGQRIAGAINVVGISHFVSFLENTESYRRDLRRVEYGDERDPAMREFLHSISPLTHAHRITKPLFVIHGKNDPRVPYTEAEQIVREVRAQGTPVWYLRADNEGHGFARRENADYQFLATVMFLRQILKL